MLEPLEFKTPITVYLLLPIVTILPRALSFLKNIFAVSVPNKTTFLLESDSSLFMFLPSFKV